MRHDQDAAVAAGTVADEAWSALLADLLGRVAGCFPRRETRQSCGQMVRGLLMELDDHNCWTIAEAVGHRGPHRMQHLLSRAVWDDQQVLGTASAWAVEHLDDGDAVLIVDETADEKSSADCVGAARQYSGTVGGIALCQVAVTLTYATGRGHALRNGGFGKTRTEDGPNDSSGARPRRFRVVLARCRCGGCSA